MKYLVKKCQKCGSLVKVLTDCNCDNCGIQCCNEEMKELIPNTEDAAFEKHIPTYKVEDGKMIITVNHVMDEEHYIEWISIVNNNEEITKHFKPNEEAKIIVDYNKGSKIYSYCNKHGLWMTEVE